MGSVGEQVAAEESRSTRWGPPSLGRRRGRFSYLVVDDILESSVGLVLSDWPVVDPQGRLRFRERPLTLGADREALETYLAEHRRPKALADRPLRIGDVFAVRTRPETMRRVGAELEDERRLNPFLEPESWIVPPVHDVTADARDEAKIAFNAAVTPTLGEAQARLLRGSEDGRAFRPPRAPNARRWLGDNWRWLGATTTVLAAGVVGGLVVDSDPSPPPLPGLQELVRIESGPGITASSFARFTFSGADNYECRLDGRGDFRPCPDAYRRLDEGDHVLEVRAAGGETVTSYPWAIVVPPEVAIRDASAVTRPGSDVTFAFVATSEGAERFQCRLDGDLFTRCDSEGSQFYDASRLAEGPHAFEVRSIERGVPGRPALHTWLVSEPGVPPAPVVRIEAGPGITSESSARFAFSGASSYECRLDRQGDFESCPEAYEDLSEGEHLLEVRAAGATNVSTYPWAIVVPPEVTIDEAPDSVGQGEAIRFAFSATPTADGFECRIDGGDFASCTSPATYEAADVGEGTVHTFEVRGTERGVRGTPEIHVWRVQIVE